MATTVDIIIKGIALCYRKGNSWHVLFPIDARGRGCHKINFSHKKGDDSDSAKTPLAQSTSITIRAPGANSASGQTDNFGRHVLNLTSAQTHPRIRRKSDLTGKAVLMTIPNARFSINRYLEEFPPHRIPKLVEQSTGSGTDLTTLAHSVKATIAVDDGGQVIVESDQLTGGQFATERGFSHTLTFDNDCEIVRPGKNDMDMFYDVIEEHDGAGNSTNRRFRIGGQGRDTLQRVIQEIIETIESGKSKEIVQQLIQLGVDEKYISLLDELSGDVESLKTLIKILSEPPNYDDGKPCLVAIVSDPGSIETLP